MANLTLTIHPWDDPNGTALCTLTDEDVSEFQMRKGKNELGAGMFKIRRDHTLATPTNMAAGNYVKVIVTQIDDTNPCFGFWLDEADDTIVANDEEGGEYLVRGGPGTLAILGRAALLNTFYNGPLGGAARGNYSATGYWTWNQEPYGAILVRLIEEGQYEPGTPLQDVTIDFIRTADSNSAAWPPDIEFIQIPIGTDGLSVYSRLIDSGKLFVVADPDLAIHAYGTSPGVDRTGTVRIEKGTSILTEMERQSRGTRDWTHVLVEGKDYSYVQVVSPDYTSGPSRWGHISYPDSNDLALLEDVGLEELANRKRMLEAVETEFDPEVYFPGDTFDVFDLVTLHTGSALTDYNEVESEVVGWSLVLGDASRSGQPRSWHAFVELNGGPTTNGFGVPAAKSGGCCGCTEGTAVPDSDPPAFVGEMYVGDEYTSDGTGTVEFQARGSGTPMQFIAGTSLVIFSDGTVGVGTESPVSGLVDVGTHPSGATRVMARVACNPVPPPPE